MTRRRNRRGDGPAQRLSLTRDEVAAVVLLVRRYLTAADRDPTMLGAIDSLLLKLLAGRRR